MGHYWSEVGDFSESYPASTTGYAHKERINAFYDGSPGSGGASCPKCGASLEWHWMDASNLLKHIDFHDTLVQDFSYGDSDGS